MDDEIKPKKHGGDVWSYSRKYGVPPEKVIDFSAPINPLGPPRKALEAIRGKVDLVRFYPDGNPISLKEAICQYVGGINLENVILGSGSMALIYLFTKVFTGKGEVLIPVPSFTEYERVTLLSGAKPKLIGLADDFSMDNEKIKREINGKTRLLIICNPHSPSGRLYDKESILDLVEFCGKKEVSILLDENYMDFVDSTENWTLATYINKYDNLFVVRSFSKFFSMPGIRVGYGIGPSKTAELLEKRRIPWEVNVLAAVAAEAALKDREYIKEARRFIRVERERMIDMLKELGCLQVFPSWTNFLLVKILKNNFSASELKEKLEMKKILIRDCSDFRNLDKSYFRVSIRKHDENLMLFNALKEILASNSSF